MGRLTIIGQQQGGLLGTPIGVGSLRVGAGNTLTVYSESVGGWVELDLVNGALATVSAEGLFSGGTTQPVTWRGTPTPFQQEDIDAVLASDQARSMTIFEDRSGFAGERFEALTFEKSGDTYVALTATFNTGIGLYRVEPDGSLTQTTHQNDTSDVASAFNRGMTVIERGSEVLILTASGGDNGVAMYRVTSDGKLQLRDTISTDEFLPVGTPEVIEAISLGGRDFAILASSGSSSLTVFEITADNRLDGVDHVVDDLPTRFDGVTAMDVFEHGGRGYVIAGGADDGLSLFALTATGRLIHLEALPDTVTSGLSNIAEIEVLDVGGDLQVFVTSASETGLTQLDLDLSSEGAEITASGGVAAGTSGDDLIFDSDAADDLTGGDGADTFIFAADVQDDRVLDFHLGVDRLDLSALGFVRDISQIQILSTPTGARLIYGGYEIELLSHDGSSYDPEDFTNADILNTSHVSLAYLGEFDETEIIGTEQSETLIGTEISQTLYGYAGDDEIRGGDGADDHRGGEGFDLAAYLDSPEGLTANLTDPDANTGIAAGDTYTDIEGLIGSDYNDTLFGNADDNEIYARAGDDWVEGGAGQDTLHGWGGNDRLDGQDGDDLLYGNEGNDALLGRAGNDVIYGGDGNDNIAAHEGDDIIYGGAGHDELGGSSGNDLLFGEEGNDVLGSGPGDDTIESGPGDDNASGGYGIDYVYGDEGNDTLAGSYGADFVYGGDGNDSLGGGLGIDHLYAGAGADQIGAGDGDDFAWGGTGGDFLGGGAGDDHLYGENGDDTLNGGDGDDVLSGGFNADTFVFNSFNAGERDTITDFKRGVDVIRMKSVAGGFNGLTLSDVTQNSQSYATVTYDEHEIWLEGLASAELTEDDFIFLA